MSKIVEKFVLYMVTTRSSGSTPGVVVRFFDNFKEAKDRFTNYKGIKLEVALVKRPDSAGEVVDLLNREGFASSVIQLLPREEHDLEAYEVVIAGQWAAEIRTAGWIAYNETRSFGPVTRVWIVASSLEMGIQIGERIIEVAELKCAYVRGIYNWSIDLIPGNVGADA